MHTIEIPHPSNHPIQKQAYVLLLSGMHKFTSKVWGVELSQDMYLALDKHFVLSTRKAYEVSIYVWGGWDC